MRDGGFEINAEEVIFTGKEGPGINDDDDLDDQYILDKRKSAQTLLTNVFHDIEYVIMREKQEAELHDLVMLNSEDLIDFIGSFSTEQELV